MCISAFATALLLVILTQCFKSIKLIFNLSYLLNFLNAVFISCVQILKHYI
nr:MAG TPA: hypothetical protein [Caudoviricetes sp.]